MADAAERSTKEKLKQKERGPAQGPVPLNTAYLAFSNDWRRGFALADILRTGSDAQESQHRNHW